MPIISLTRDIKLTNEDALKILNSKPSENLQFILKSIESKKSINQKKNKLISKYLWCDNDVEKKKSQQSWDLINSKKRW